MGPSKIRVEKGQEVKWCACGMSSKQPFCDGSHKKEGNKTPITFKALETKVNAYQS
jgi:CDGSH-type Zn-finger protein